MRFLAKELPIAALGFFALVSQTLLFRDFLTCLEGNEIAVGTFFASWLLWVGVGAVAGNFFASRFPEILQRFLLLPLLYLPAFLFQQNLIGAAREILGIESFILVPLPSLLAFAALANVPTSFLSGALFSMACTWVASTFALPVARVYIIETAGGFVGGLFVTGLLSLGMPGEKVFLYAALLLCTSLLVPRKMSLWHGGFLAASTATLFFAVTYLGDLVADHRTRTEWSRLLPADTYGGSFLTAQSRYLYGERGGDFIVMTEGAVIETLPEEEHASAVVAWAMAENPGAENALLIGPGGPAITNRLKVLPQVREVVWLYPDPEFPGKLLQVLPGKVRQTLGNIDAPQQEVRTFLNQTQKRFDLVLVNLPETTNLVLNRYASLNFFSLVKNVLAPGGICAVRVTGAANYIGDERVLTGASTLTTLSAVFPRVAMKPGDETFLFATIDGSLSESSTELAKRFGEIDGSDHLYPQEGLLAAFPQDRIAFQRNRFQQIEKTYGKGLLENTDEHPKALLFDLLLSLRRAGLGSVATGAVFLVDKGLDICLAGIFLFALLRVFYLRTSPREGTVHSAETAPNLFDVQLMLFTAGLVGMAATVVLVFSFQVRFGSLFLHMGLISSLFMLGSTFGGMASERFLTHTSGRAVCNIILIFTICETIFFIIMIFLLPTDLSRLAFAFFFTFVGFFAGLYFPVAAACLHTGGYPVDIVAGRLEFLDHLGGAVGAAATGILLLPFVGVQASMAIMMTAVLAVNFIAQSTRLQGVAPVTEDRFDKNRRRIGYLLFGAGAFAMMISEGVRTSQGDHETADFLAAAAEMAPGLGREEKTHPSSPGETLLYYQVAGGYIFPSAPLARGIRGYAGEIPLAVWIDGQGILKDLRLLRSNETPVYLSFLRGWLAGLKDLEMFTAEPFQGIDAVSGATLSSAAILKTLSRSTKAFGEVVLGHPAADLISSPLALPRWQTAALFLWTILILAARYRPGRWLRRFLLAVSFIFFGLVLNLQYASQQVVALLSGNFSWEITSSGFFLVMIVPLGVALFGNIYCGYLCPFGALQELIGDLRPRRFLADPRKRIWRYGRFAKYLVLFFFLLLFALTRDFSVLHADPLITIFAVVRDRTVIILSFVLLVLAFFFRRFWCRNLCPAGAFLALLGRLRLLRHFLPETQPEKCDLGVRNHREFDCLQCDRCRHAKK